MKEVNPKKIDYFLGYRGKDLPFDTTHAEEEVISKEEAFEQAIEKIGDLYEEGKECVNWLMPGTGPGVAAAQRLYAILQELRDQACMNLKQIIDPEKLNKALDLLEAYEQWDADIISSDESWSPQGMASHPKMTEQQYDRWMELAEQRKQVLGRLQASTANASVAPDTAEYEDRQAELSRRAEYEERGCYCEEGELPFCTCHA